MICKIFVEHRSVSHCWSEFVGAMVSSGSVVDAWFVELLHIVVAAESFLLCRIYGVNMDLYLLWFRETFRVDLLFSGRERFHCCLFIFGVRKCFVFWITFTSLYIKVLLYVREVVPSVGSKRDSSFDVLK
jgi:hypothetical protein